MRLSLRHRKRYAPTKRAKPASTIAGPGGTSTAFENTNPPTQLNSAALRDKPVMSPMLRPKRVPTAPGRTNIAVTNSTPTTLDETMTVAATRIISPYRKYQTGTPLAWASSSSKVHFPSHRQQQQHSEAVTTASPTRSQHSSGFTASRLPKKKCSRCPDYRFRSDNKRMPNAKAAT